MLPARRVYSRPPAAVIEANVGPAETSGVLGAVWPSFWSTSIPETALLIAIVSHCAHDFSDAAAAGDLGKFVACRG